MVKLYLIFLFILILEGSIVFWINHNFLHQLKTKHNKKWEELGKPVFFQNNIKLLNYLRKKEYINLNDKELIKIGNYLRAFSFTYLLTFFVIAIFFLWSINIFSE